jgi:hypothetical protein
MPKGTTETDTSNKICVDCQKETQRDVTVAAVSVAADGQACAELYQSVVSCMSAQKGQIAPCVEQWDAFRTCHEKHNDNVRVVNAPVVVSRDGN